MKKASVKNKESENNVSHEFRKMGVIMEDMNSKIDLLVEGYSSLDKKIDRVHAELKEDLNDFKVETRGNFKIVFEQISNVNIDLQSFKNETRDNFKKVFEYLSRIDDEVQDIKSEILEIKLVLKKKADISRLAVMEKKIQIIERVLMREKILQKQKQYS